MWSDQIRVLVRALQDGFIKGNFAAVPAMPERRTEIVELLKSLMAGTIPQFAEYIQLLNAAESDRGVEFQAAWGFRLVPTCPIDEIVASGFNNVDDGVLGDLVISTAGLEALWDAWHLDGETFIVDRCDD